MTISFHFILQCGTFSSLIWQWNFRRDCRTWNW